jgi:hypothetical protein
MPEVTLPTLAEWNALIAKVRERVYAGGASDFDTTGFRAYYPNTFDAAARPTQDMQSYRLIEQLQKYIKGLFLDGLEYYTSGNPIFWATSRMMVMRNGMTLNGGPCKMLEEYSPDPDYAGQWAPNQPTSFREHDIAEEGDPPNIVPAYYVYRSMNEVRIDAGLTDYSAKAEAFDEARDWAFRRITPRSVVRQTGEGVFQPMTHDTEGNVCQVGHRAWEVISAPWAVTPPDSTPYYQTGRAIELGLSGWTYVNGVLPDVLDSENDRPNYARMGFMRGADYLAFREHYDELLAMINLVHKYAMLAIFLPTSVIDRGQAWKAYGAPPPSPDNETWAAATTYSRAAYTAAAATAGSETIEKWERGFISAGSPTTYLPGYHSATAAIGHMMIANPLEIAKQYDFYWTPIRHRELWAMRRPAAIAAWDADEAAACRLAIWDDHGTGFVRDVWNHAGTVNSASEGVWIGSPLISNLNLPTLGSAPTLLPGCTGVTDRYRGFRAYMTAVEVTPTFTT